MKRTNKLYFSLGLLFFAPSITFTCEDESINCKDESINIEIQIEIIEDVVEEIIEEIVIENPMSELEKAQKEIDKELYDLFSKFFNEHDTTPFSKIVHKVITILKVQRNSLHGHQQIKCDELIKTFERNKHSTSFPTWANILITPDLLNLLSKDTRSYINGIPNHIKIKTLIRKLQK